MKKLIFKLSVAAIMTSAGFWAVMPSSADDAATDAASTDTTATPTQPDATEATPKTDSVEKPKEDAPAETAAPATKPAKNARRIERADAFLAGPDWDFDGYVAGGQDSKVRSMFYLNDLVYVNIGAQHGIAPGDKLGIYKRGDRVRDPQTGKFIGYEVRRAAIARASDRVEDEVAAVRITNTYEAVEIGDLVRREK